MLVISRKENEAIVIDLGDEVIEITITELGKQVRLGIEAPAGRKIWRKEIYTTLQENKQAAKELGSHNVRDILRTLQTKAQSETDSE